MTEFKVPELGENVATGDVTKVLVNVGDTITHEQPVLELETDKATIEVPSSVAGVVKEHKFIRADRFAGLDDAVEVSLSKGRQIVDEQGDRLFG